VLKRLIIGAGLAAGAVAAAVAFGGWRWVTPVRKRETAYVEGMSPEEVWIVSEDGTALFGIYLEGRAKSPGIVFCHGYFKDHRQPLEVARALNDAGYHVLLFDFRGSGRSEGDHTTAGYLEVWDVVGAVRYLKDRTGERPIGVLGISMGAAAAITAATEIDDIAAIVADSPFAHLEGVMRENVREIVPHPLLEPLAWASIRIGNQISGGDYKHVRPVDSIAELESTPILVIYGERDEYISSGQIDELIQAATGPKELWILDCRHGMAQQAEPEEYLNRVLRFFEANLGGKKRTPRRKSATRKSGS
jgi:pimeloyl-ACP methyl ester carboxylesterase